jgi:hypothetical protein
MSRDEIEAVVAALGELARVVQDADPEDKADIYAKFRLTLIYQPEEKLVQATIKPGLNMRKGFVSEAEGLPVGHDSEIAATGLPSAGNGAPAVGEATLLTAWTTYDSAPRMSGHGEP